MKARLVVRPDYCMALHAMYDTVHRALILDTLIQYVV